MTTIIAIAARFVPALPLSKKNSGSPIKRAAAKQTICRFVRLKATFVLTLERSLGTGTYAKKKPPFVEYGFCQCAGFEQGKTEDNRIGGKGKYRAVQIVCDYHVVYQYGVNTDTYHNEEALKTKSEQPF